METQNRISRFLAYLALLVALIGVPALGLGTTLQTLTWQGNTNAILALNTAHPLSATASSGLPVTLRVDSGPASIGNGTITVGAVGTVWVTAEQAGDATYAAARVTRSFNVRQVALTRVGGYDSGGSGPNVQVAGNYAYVVGTRGFEVVDVSNPVNAVRVGGFYTDCCAFYVQVAGNYAYAGLEVIDVSKPANPVRVGRLQYTGGEARDLQVVGTYAFLADGELGLQVIDVSKPAKPVRVGGYDTLGHASGVQVVGTYAYVADWSAGMQVIDVSNPASPVRVGGYDTLGYALRVQVVGNYAYVADYDAGLQVIDVSNPASPVRVGGFKTNGSAQGVEVVENYAYVVCGHSGLQVIDVINPASPILAGSYGANSSSVGNYVDVQVVGNYAYVVDWNSGLQIFELSLNYPQAITWQGNTNAILALNTAHPLNATASSGLSVTLRVESGPAVIADGMITVTELGTVVVTAEQAGDDTYLPARVTRSFNIRQAVLTPVGGYLPGGKAFGVQVAGNYAYVAYGYAGLEVLDISNPAQPVRVGGYVTPSQTRDVQAVGVQVVGNYVYLVDWGTWDGQKYAGGFQVIDVSDPAKSTRVGHIDNGSAIVTGVQVVGNYAFVANGSAGLQVIGVSTPAKPVRVGGLGGYDTTGNASGVQVVGNYAYVADAGYFNNSTFDHGGLRLIDVSNPATPVWLGGLNTSGSPSGVQVVGNYAYLANAGYYGGGAYYNGELHVVDVRNQATPVQVGGYQIRGTVKGVQVAKNYAYVVDGGEWDGSNYTKGGLQVIDVSDPAQPVRVGGYVTRAAATSVQIVGNYAYVTTGAGLQILELRLGYPQTLHLRLPSEVSLGLQAGSVGAASSGLPVTLSVVSGAASAVNNQVTWTGLGPVALRAEQAGNDFYLPASAEWTVTVIPRRLGARLAGGQVEVFWANGYDGLQLQGRESLAPESPWQNVTTPPVETDDEARVPLDPASPHRYFRLLKP